MARWIDQTLKLDASVQIDLTSDYVWIGSPEDPDVLPGPAMFHPASREEANRMSIALKMAAKRLEDIGKGLP